MLLPGEHNLACSHEAIRRILNEHGLTRKRVKKHKRKRSLREIKKHWKLFGQITVDTKDLKDIPHYWPQMKMLKLPKYQFTAREIRSGLMFLGFANEDVAFIVSFGGYYDTFDLLASITTGVISYDGHEESWDSKSL
jgi:hypothetical protein